MWLDAHTSPWQEAQVLPRLLPRGLGVGGTMLTLSCYTKRNKEKHPLFCKGLKHFDSPPS